MHPTPKARIGHDHHNGAVGEAKNEHAWPDVLRRTDSPVTGGSPPRPNPSGREGPFGGLRSRVIPDAVPSPRHLACPSVWVGTLPSRSPPRRRQSGAVLTQRTRVSRHPHIALRTPTTLPPASTASTRAPRASVPKTCLMRTTDGYLRRCKIVRKGWRPQGESHV